MKLILFVLLLASPIFALDTAKIQDQIDSLQVILSTAMSDSVAAHLDSLVQADKTLKEAGVKVVSGAAHDDMWANLDLSKLTDEQRVLVKIALLEGKIEYQKTDDPAILYMRKDWIEKGIPIISAALK